MQSNVIFRKMSSISNVIITLHNVTTLFPKFKCHIFGDHSENYEVIIHFHAYFLQFFLMDMSVYIYGHDCLRCIHETP